MQQKFYSPGQSMNAFMVGDQMGQQKRKRETQNAFSQMIGDKDYSGARDYAYGRGAMELGGAADGILAGQAEQQKAQDTDKARMAYEGLKAVSQETDPQSRMQMAQQLSQQLGIPAPDDPNDLSDHEIARQLEVMRIQGGFEEESSEGRARFGNSLTEVIGPDGNPMFVRTDDQGGIHPVDGYTPPPDVQQGSSDRVQSTFTDANGNLQLVMRDGTIRSSGMGVQNPFQITDVGGVPTAIDRRTGQGISISTPEEVGSNAATIQTVKDNEAYRGEAQRSLPQVIENANRSLSAIDGLLSSPGFDSRYGMTSVIPAIPGTEMANTQSFIDQIGGQAFLEAFQSLKGGGQITEIEGQKATAAITRLGTQGIQPQEARKAAQELRDIIARGLEKAKAEASGSYAPQGADAPPLVYNPETGDFD